MTLWDPDDTDLAARDMRGRGVWVAGSVQRRFWSGDEGRGSRIEVVAHDIKVRDERDPTTWEAHVDA